MLHINQQSFKSFFENIFSEEKNNFSQLSIAIQKYKDVKLVGINV